MDNCCWLRRQKVCYALWGNSEYFWSNYLSESIYNGSKSVVLCFEPQRWNNVVNAENYAKMLWQIAVMLSLEILWSEKKTKQTTFQTNNKLFRENCVKEFFDRSLKASELFFEIFRKPYDIVKKEYKHM